MGEIKGRGIGMLRERKEGEKRGGREILRRLEKGEEESG